MGIVFALTIWIVLFTQNQTPQSSVSNPIPRTSAPTSSPSRMTAAERNYLGAATSYLMEAYEEGNKMAHTMAGATNGSSSLSDIRNAITSAKRVENFGYIGDYQDRIKGKIPSRVADIAVEVGETHRLFQSSTNELLQYWRDQNPAHITSGTTVFERCIREMNTAISDAHKKIQELGGKGS